MHEFQHLLHQDELTFNSIVHDIFEVPYSFLCVVMHDLWFVSPIKEKLSFHFSK